MSANKILKRLEKDQEDLSKKRDARCVPIARAVMAKVGLATQDSPLGAVTKKEEIMKYADAVAKDIIREMQAGGALIQDIDFIKQISLQTFGAAFEIITNSFNHHLTTLQKKTFGKEIGELTLDELDDKLKA